MSFLQNIFMRKSTVVRDTRVEDAYRTMTEAWIKRERLERQVRLNKRHLMVDTKLIMTKTQAIGMSRLRRRN